MTRKNSTMFALLFVFNPFLMLFFQNCSSSAKPIAKNTVIEKVERRPTSYRSELAK